MMDEWEFDAEACCRAMQEEIDFEFNRMMEERRREFSTNTS